MCFSAKQLQRPHWQALARQQKHVQAGAGLQMHEVPLRAELAKAFAPGTAFVQLTVEVQEPSLAFLLGSKWSVISDPPITLKAIAQAWQMIAIQYSKAMTYTATAMSDMDTLLGLAQCKQADILPAAVALHTVTASALETAPAASRPLVMLIHVLGAVAGTKPNTPVDFATQHFKFPEGRGTASPTSFESLKLETEMKQLALQKFKEDSNTEFSVDQQDVVPVLMRSAILLLKVADLTPLLSTTEDASNLLWLSIAGLGKSLRETPTHLQH